MEALDQAGRVAVVTGAGRGVGRQIALDLAACGAMVAVNDYDAGRAKTVADEVEAAGGRAIALACDVSDHHAVADAFEHVRAELGPIAVLVNNAGNRGPDLTGHEEAPFWETGPGDWSIWLSVNLYGVLNCSKFALKQMVESRYGRIVTVISDAARVGEVGLEVYGAAKAGAAGLMRALARAGGRYGITANCVSLAVTRTPAVEADLQDTALVKRVLGNYAVRRVGEPTDAAHAVMFLASPGASWVTGQTLPVNGGYSMAL